VSARRTRFDDAWLHSTLRSSTLRLRAGAAPSTRAELRRRDIAEQLEFALQLALPPGLLGEGALNLPGRTTGSLAWRTARGETGSQADAGALPTPGHTPWVVVTPGAPGVTEPA
ncbi:N-glycanase 1, partial [Haematococcus lacustris]